MAKTQAAQRLCKEEDLAVEVGHLREEKSQAITRAEGAMSDAQMVQICTSSAIHKAFCRPVMPFKPQGLLLLL